MVWNLLLQPAFTQFIRMRCCYAPQWTEIDENNAFFAMINIIIHFEAHCQIRTQKSKKRKIAEFSPIRYHTHSLVYG